LLVAGVRKVSKDHYAERCDLCVTLASSAVSGTQLNIVKLEDKSEYVFVFVKLCTELRMEGHYGNDQEFSGFGSISTCFAGGETGFCAHQEFPRDEKYSMTDQIRRSSRAVNAMVSDDPTRRRLLQIFHQEMMFMPEIGFSTTIQTMIATTINRFTSVIKRRFSIFDPRALPSRPRLTALLLGLLLAATACRQDMHDQPRYEPLEATTFFKDGRASRPLVEGTVARGQLRIDDHFYRGMIDTALATTFPFPVTKDVLERGQERYNIFCAPCHDRVGTGKGMIVQRGFRHPPSFHLDRLRRAPVGHFFDVITNGFGAMYSYAGRIPPGDRWAIIAYIRALQLSQNATIDEVPAGQRQKLLRAEP